MKFGVGVIFCVLVILLLACQPIADSGEILPSPKISLSPTSAPETIIDELSLPIKIATIIPDTPAGEQIAAGSRFYAEKYPDRVSLVAPWEKCDGIIIADGSAVPQNYPGVSLSVGKDDAKATISYYVFDAELGAQMANTVLEQCAEKAIYGGSIAYFSCSGYSPGLAAIKEVFSKNAPEFTLVERVISAEGEAADSSALALIESTPNLVGIICMGNQASSSIASGKIITGIDAVIASQTSEEVAADFRFYIDNFELGKNSIDMLFQVIINGAEVERTVGVEIVTDNLSFSS